MEVKDTKDWKYWLAVVVAIVGVFMIVVGMIANWVYMGETLGVISFLSIVYSHWSFWVLLSGLLILAILYIVIKICKKNVN